MRNPVDAEVGHEHDRYQAIITEAQGDTATVILRNVEEGSALCSLEKQVRLSAGARLVCVKYVVPPAVRRLSTEVSLSPDYYRLLRDGHGASPAGVGRKPECRLDRRAAAGRGLARPVPQHTDQSPAQDHGRKRTGGFGGVAR